MIGEISNVELQAKYTANNDKLHMAYSFDLLRDEFSPKHIRNTVSKFFKETKDGWPTWSFSNHDVVGICLGGIKQKKIDKNLQN